MAGAPEKEKRGANRKEERNKADKKKGAPGNAAEKTKKKKKHGRKEKTKEADRQREKGEREACEGNEHEEKLKEDGRRVQEAARIEREEGRSLRARPADLGPPR